MRYMLTIIAFLLFAEFAGPVQLLKWAGAATIFDLADTTDAEEEGKKKLVENEFKTLHIFHFPLKPLVSSQELYIHKACLLPKGYDRSVYQPPRFSRYLA